MGLTGVQHNTLIFVTSSFVKSFFHVVLDERTNFSAPYIYPLVVKDTFLLIHAQNKIHLKTKVSKGINFILFLLEKKDDS